VASGEPEATAAREQEGMRQLPLVVLMLPILVPLLLIAFGAFAELGGWSNAFIAFLGDANVALFVRLLGAYFLSPASSGREPTHQTMEDGTVTLRDRDTLEQVRIAAAELGSELERRLAAPWTSPKRG